MSERPTKYDAWAYVLIGLLALPVLALGIGALVLPPGISFALVRRGLAEGRTSWLVLGVLTGALWLLLLAVSIRRVIRAQPRDATEDGTEPPTTGTDTDTGAGTGTGSSNPR